MSVETEIERTKRNLSELEEQKRQKDNADEQYLQNTSEENLRARLISALKISKQISNRKLCGDDDAKMQLTFQIAKSLQRQAVVKIDFTEGKNVFRRGRRWKKFLQEEAKQKPSVTVGVFKPMMPAERAISQGLQPVIPDYEKKKGDE
jgi:hypothetical protein